MNYIHNLLKVCQALRISSSCWDRCGRIWSFSLIILDFTQLTAASISLYFRIMPRVDYKVREIEGSGTCSCEPSPFQSTLLKILHQRKTVCSSIP